MVCRNWKPERAHHCSVCETCVLKMDHHCPWLGNCVGYHNFKEFFLFCFYQMVDLFIKCILQLIGVIYSPQMIMYAFYRDDNDTHDLSTFGYLCYYLTNVLAVPIAFSLIFLSSSILVQIYNNITSLERLSMRQMKVPCIGPVKAEYSFPNEYDMTWLSNFRQILGERMWQWFLPIDVEMKG